jgi:CMP/dCMP kinase
MIISISGSHGSGKSTIAKMLSNKFGWPSYSMGGLRREAAKKKGLTLAEHNKLGEEDPSTDLEVDLYQKNLGQTKNNFIIEGRTSWYFIPHSLKIFLDVKKEIGAKRIFDHLGKENDRNEGRNLNTLNDVVLSVTERYESDKKRYKKYFNIDVYDHSNYDFYLDTSNLSIEDVFKKTLTFIKEKKKEKSIDK